MKLKDNLLLRRVAGSWVVVAVGDACTDFNGMLSLNDSGALLWRALEHGENLQKTLTDEFNITPDEATRDIEAFLNTLRAAHCLEDESV